jgi:hypothetical protein
MMTRKDYVSTAEILANYRRTFYSVSEKSADAFDEIVNDFADMFAEDNERFMRSKFIDACLGEDF